MAMGPCAVQPRHGSHCLVRNGAQRSAESVQCLIVQQPSLCRHLCSRPCPMWLRMGVQSTLPSSTLSTSAQTIICEPCSVSRNSSHGLHDPDMNDMTFLCTLQEVRADWINHEWYHLLLASSDILLKPYCPATSLLFACQDMGISANMIMLPERSSSSTPLYSKACTLGSLHESGC